MAPVTVTNRFNYDVVISFRGEDTRHGFAGNLSKTLQDRGIRVIMDDLKLQNGEELVQAIERARTGIIVFSKNYASSTFCLQELSNIYDCIKEKGRPVWPVFYDMDRFDVQNLTGTYGEAMATHEARSNLNMDQLQKWKMALLQVADLFGFHIKTGVGDDESESIGRIVKEVSAKLNHAPLYVADYPVGLKSRLEEVLSLLELKSDGVLMVGFYGMPGVGKTTLAQAVCNMIAGQFEGLYFLDRVGENSDKHGLLYLQNVLLSEIVGEKHIQLGNVHEAVSMLKRRLPRKKILLILDDVDRLEQLEALAGEPDWFGSSGSRVIITTRDRHLLAFHQVERRYEVRELNHGDALELLSYRIFKQGDVDPSYSEILNQVVAYASGLPLALEAIGSDLIGKSMDECKQALNQLKRNPHNYIQNIHKTSFDALGKAEQCVFLDIASCFNGYELTEVQDILCAAHHGHDVKSHIEVLIDKSFISVSSDGKVTLNPLIERMGKEMVLGESSTVPGNRSRLWLREDIVQVLKEKTGTSKIEIIHLDSPFVEDEEVIEWDGEAFKKMENLRTLIIRRCHFSKAPKHLPHSLRVLEWWGYPSQDLPSDFDPKQLDICKLPNMGSMSPKLTALLKISQSAREVLQTSQRVVQFTLKISQRVSQAKMTWRIAGLVSSVVGLLCNALSPSFNRLIGGRNSFKLSVYGVVSLAFCTFILRIKPSSFFRKHVQLKTFMNFVILMGISVYSFFYDKAVDGKPEIRSLVSNAAFALVSLSLSKLMEFGFEMGIFSYFLGCLSIQLLTINRKLILVAMVLCFPLFLLHSSSGSRPEADDGGQAIHSSLDLEPKADNGSQVINSYSKSQREATCGAQHVVRIHT